MALTIRGEQRDHGSGEIEGKEMDMRTGLRTVLGVLVMFTLALMFVVSCGDDDSADEAVESTTSTEVAEEATTTEETTTTTEEATTTTAPTEAALTLEVVDDRMHEGAAQFTATGEAVDQGLICAAGEGELLNFVEAETGQPPPWPEDPENLLVDWEFTCADGSGQFTMQVAQPAYNDEMLAPFIASGEVIDEGETWEIISGTDSYTNLNGQGTRTWLVLVPGVGDTTETTYIGTCSTSPTVGDDEVSVSDFEGMWEATSYVVYPNDNPEASFDLVTMGAVLSVEADDSGNVTGDLEIPELIGGPMTLPFNAVFEIVDPQTLTVTFVEEIPPLLTSSTGPFTYEEDIMTITDNGALFDFEDGNGPVPATAVATLERS